MKQIFQQLVNLGTSDIESELKKAQIQIFNLSCLSGIFFPTAATISFLSLSMLEVEHILLAIVMDIGFCFLLYLNAKGKFTLSSFLVPLTCFSAVVFVFILYGGKTDHEFIFLAISVSPFLFPSAKYWLRFFFMAIFMLAFLVCAHISFSPFIELTPDIIAITNSHIYWIITGLLLYQILALHHLYQVVVKDLIDKKAQMVQAKEQAEENNRLKSAFLANISHEIRTPMNIVMGFSNHLLEDQITPVNRKQYAEFIYSSSQRLLSTVNDILDISKIETNQIQVDNQAVHIINLMKDLHFSFLETATTKGLDYKLEISLSEEFSRVFTDEVKLRQILINYISNAIKYTEKGSVTLGCKLIGHHLEFYVRDTGIGIPPHLQKAVFERFRQVDNFMSEGTGLGLAISKGLAELLKGEVWIDSTPGEGSTFFLRIPYLQIPDQKTPKPNKHKAVLSERIQLVSSPKKILVAEDELFNFRLLEIMLRELNATIIWVQNGAEAIAAVKDDPSFDLVLMDLKMPVMGGLEASRILKSLYPNLYIVAQSAFAYQEDKALALEAGCSYYLTKPINKEELLGLLYEPKQMQLVY